MRRFLRVIFVCSFAVFCGFAHAQETDIAVSGSTLFSTKARTASLANIRPPEKGSTYPGASLEVVLPNHFGINAEGFYRYHEGLYDGYQSYRPVFVDINGVFVHQVSNKARLDFMAGVGGERLIFYNATSNCPASSCRNLISSDHFLEHVGVGVRYYPWSLLGHLFVRPEAHYFHIQGNTSVFSTNNVYRLGASVGYTFGGK